MFVIEEICFYGIGSTAFQYARERPEASATERTLRSVASVVTTGKPIVVCGETSPVMKCPVTFTKIKPRSPTGSTVRYLLTNHVVVVVVGM